jgi:hypothetical protein
MKLWLPVIVGALLLAQPATAGDKKTKDIKFTDEEAGEIILKPPKPEVWYILPRSVMDFTRKLLKQKLARKIGEATKKAPF